MLHGLNSPVNMGLEYEDAFVREAASRRDALTDSGVSVAGLTVCAETILNEATVYKL